MQQKRDELVPIREAFSDLNDGPVETLCQPSPQARHHFTQADQVHQLVGASEADPDLGFMARMMAILFVAPYQPGQPAPVCPAQRPLRALHDRRWWQ